MTRAQCVARLAKHGLELDRDSGRVPGYGGFRAVVKWPDGRQVTVRNPYMPAFQFWAEVARTVVGEGK